MTVVSDLKRRTGVGAGGILLYAFALVAGLVGATLRAQVDFSDGEVLLFLTGVVYAVGLLGIVAAVSNTPRFLRLAAYRRRGVREGRIAATGTVETAGGTLTTPFGSEPAVYHAYRVLENDRDDDAEPDDESNWELVTTGEDGTAFSLVTDSGTRVRVDPTDSAPHLVGSDEVFVDAGEKPPGRILEFCRDAGVHPATSGTARRYEETVLSPGDDGFVLGRAVDEAGYVVRDGTPFVVADSDYPTRVRDRVTFGFALGLPVTLVGFGTMLLAGGAL